MLSIISTINGLIEQQNVLLVMVEIKPCQNTDAPIYFVPQFRRRVDGAE